MVFAYSSVSGILTVSFDSCTITANIAQQVSMRHSVMRRCMLASGSTPIDAMASAVVGRECVRSGEA